ncbi:MAG: hypothetical protein QG658_411 [Patescibacteria group bacterium]|nr:hypothetical protein [Patescibacteria group bacterium]
MIADILAWLWQLIIGVGLALALAYLVYMLGLGLVFRRLGEKMWLAYVPAYNYLVLIRILGLPKSWQAVVFVPYLGPIYSIPIGIRLGKIFGKGAAFSSFWLTLGAPVGMLIIAFSKKPLNLDVIKEPTPHIDTKKLKQLSKKHRA